MGLFCEDGRRRLGELRRSLEADDFFLFAVTVRGIASAGKSIGAVPLAEAAGRLETEGRERNGDYVRDNSPVFMENLEALINRIEQTLPRLKPKFRN